MDAVVLCQSNSLQPPDQEPAEIKRPSSIDGLIAVVRAHEDYVFSHARERAIDPLTLRTQLLLHLPRLITADYFPGEGDIRREVLAVSDFLEESQRPYAWWLKQPEAPIALGDLPASLALIEEQAHAIAHLVTLGGDHGITLPLLRALAKKRGPGALIHFDAHVDTWPDNFGQAYAHGCVFHHAIIEGLIEPRRMVQIGIRSPVSREVHDWTLAQGVTSLTAQEVHETGPAAIAGRIREPSPRPPPRTPGS